jgi:hypothetical protein
VAGLVPLTPAGTDIELEVLFDAALNGGRLDWTDVIPKLDGKGPLLFIARTDKGFMVLLDAALTDMHTAMCLADSGCFRLSSEPESAKTTSRSCFG